MPSRPNLACFGASGHPTRLNRETLNESYRFGDLAYAKEELRAELASVSLMADRYIPHNPDRHAAYLSSSINALKQEKRNLSRRPRCPPRRRFPDRPGALQSIDQALAHVNTLQPPIARRWHFQ